MEARGDSSCASLPCGNELAREIAWETNYRESYMVWVGRSDCSAPAR